MYTECSVQISDFFDYCFLFLCKFFKLHLIAKYFIKIVLTARFVDIFPSLKMKILLNPFDFLLFRHPIMQLKEKNSKKKFLHVYKNECVLRHCAWCAFAVLNMTQFLFKTKLSLKKANLQILALYICKCLRVISPISMKINYNINQKLGI